MQTFTLQIAPTATLTAYLLHNSPEMQVPATRPAVLVFPGGGYTFCSDREAEPIALAYSAAGFHTFVLRYTVGKGHTFSEPLTDAETAISHIRENSAKWGIDPAKLAVCGFSAGGHLAASVSTKIENRPNAAILVYPCILDNLTHLLSFPVPSCIDFVDEETTPAFLFHTADDALVPVSQSLDYAAALSAAGVPFELHILPHGPHGLALANETTANGDPDMISPSAAEWLAQSVRWLNDLFSTGKD